MADFVDLDGLKALVQTLCGPLVQVAWGNEPLPFDGRSGLDATGYPIPAAGAVLPPPDGVDAGGAVRVTLDVPSSSGVGVDDQRRSFNSGTNKQTVTQTGIRHLTLQIKVECDQVNAIGVCERLRTAFAKRSTLDALKELGCAVRRVSDVRAISATWDERVIDADILEVFLAFGVNSPDVIGETGTEVPNNWIQTVTPLDYEEP